MLSQGEMQMSKDKIHIDGVGNIAAGGNVSISSGKSLPEQFRKKINEVDKKIEGMLPGGRLLAPTMNNTFQPFSSGKILTSLFHIGIPVEVGISVIDSLDKYLKKVIAGQPQITTAHVRKAVSLTLYGTNEDGFSEGDVQIWGDLYARRYGNPDERIKVIHRNGEFDNLDYHFLVNTLIPHLAERILHIPPQKIKKYVLSKIKMRRMAELIIEHVKNMNLYSIRYKTLLYIAQDFAVQPPHPWFVEDAFISPSVDYDLERAADHSMRMKEGFDGGDIIASKHSCSECVHHSCSAILGFYGAYLGCKHLEPLFNLITWLDICVKDDNMALWEFCKIKQIEGDLQAVGVDISDFLNLLDRISKHVSVIHDNRLKNLINNAEKLNNITLEIINNRRMVIRKTSKDHIKKFISNDEQLQKLTKEIFKRIPQCRVISNENGTNYFWLIHDINTAVFREIKPKILVAPVYVSKVVEIEELKAISTSIKNIISDNADYTNVVVFVSSAKYSGECRKFAKCQKDELCRPVLATLRDIIGIYNSNTRISDIENFIVNN